MEKTEVYSWRLDPDLKGALELAARAQGTSVSRLLDRIAGEWLRRKGESRAAQEEQEQVRTRAMRLVGSIQGKGPRRAREASERVRALLVRKHARRRTD